MLRYVKSGMMLMSIAYIVLGLMLLIMPETSLLWICYAFGVVVLITGIVCLIQYARIRGTGFTAPFMLVGGVITAGLGLFTLAKPQVVASFLPVVFGIFIVVDGCSRIGSAIDLAKRKGEKWWMLLLFSIVSIALGALLIWLLSAPSPPLWWGPHSFWGRWGAIFLPLTCLISAPGVRWWSGFAIRSNILFTASAPCSAGCCSAFL